MIPEDVSPEYRDKVRAALVSRMHRTPNKDWREFWRSETLFLDGRGQEAAEGLRELVASKEPGVAIAALISLGEWYEQSGAVDLAQEAYRAAIAIADDTPSDISARTKLARLYNTAHQATLAISILETTANNIGSVRAEAVQFVLTEYCQALRDLGQIQNAREVFQKARSAFPDRLELELLEQQLLG